ALTFVFTIKYIFFIGILWFIIISFKQSNEVAVYNNNNLLPWDKNTNNISMLKLTYNNNNKCLLRNKNFLKKEEKNILFTYTANEEDIQIKKKQSRTKLLFFTIFHSIIFINIPLLIISNFDIFYINSKKVKKSTKTKNFFSTRKIMLPIINYQRSSSVSSFIFDKKYESFYGRNSNNNLGSYSKYNKTIIMHYQESPLYSYC
uniref:Uncharacterized protein n=1 Tax=Strongyloides stercoralis TaxID=6248 RepID=A0AAF5I273_STRER